MPGGIRMRVSQVRAAYYRRPPGFTRDFVYLSFSYHSFNPLSPYVEILFVREGFDFKSMRG